MNEILRKLPRMVCHIDDILVTGRNKKEHDTHLHVVLKKLEAAGITLNKVLPQQNSVPWPCD